MRTVDGVSEYSFSEIRIVCRAEPPPEDGREVPQHAATSSESGRRTSRRRIVSSYGVSRDAVRFPRYGVAAAGP